MSLNPERYECPEHHTDLTDLVEEKLEDEGPPVAYWGLRGRQGGGQHGAQLFRVIVTCPSGGRHDLTFSGTQTR